MSSEFKLLTCADFRANWFLFNCWGFKTGDLGLYGGDCEVDFLLEYDAV
jgi:hypothetical protein